MHKTATEICRFFSSGKLKFFHKYIILQISENLLIFPTMVSAVKFFKEVLKISGLTVLSIIFVPLMVYLLCVGCIAVFCMTVGSGCHIRQMETQMLVNGEKENVSIYKAVNKPYLLIGPYRFDRDNHDFFFVSRTEVIRTSTTQGGSCWVRFLGLLFIFDDLSHWDCVRLPYWDDLENDKNSSVKSENGKRVFRFMIKNPDRAVEFAVPEKLFTPDMDTAYNFIKANKESDRK